MKLHVLRHPQCQVLAHKAGSSGRTGTQLAEESAGPKPLTSNTHLQSVTFTWQHPHSGLRAHTQTNQTHTDHSWEGTQLSQSHFYSLHSLLCLETAPEGSARHLLHSPGNKPQTRPNLNRGKVLPCPPWLFRAGEPQAGPALGMLLGLL